jgi:hypothetical protein
VSDSRQLPSSPDYPETAEYFQMTAVGRHKSLFLTGMALSANPFLSATRPHGGLIAMLHSVNRKKAFCGKE